jgi:acetate CoA/acetoacetate CoA-transferase alpha subunit
MGKYITLQHLKEHLFDGMTIMVGGFMCTGTPEMIIDEIVHQNIQDITIICNDAGFENQGVGKLIKNNQVKKLIASHIGLNPYAGKCMSENKMEIILVPQGTLAEQIRAKGAGLGGVLTPTGVGTIVAKGKEVITINEKEYLLEEPIGADLAIIYASETDENGNAMFTKTTRNFNPIMATAADKVIALSRKKVEYINPDYIHTPYIFVDYIIEEEHYE